MVDLDREPPGNIAAEPDAARSKKRRHASGAEREGHNGAGDGAPIFRRGNAANTKNMADRKLRGKLQHSDALAEEAATSAMAAYQWLMPSEGGSLEAEGLERTWQYSQQAIVQEAEEGARQKAFDLNLGVLGPYSLSFTRSGRFALLGGRKGHLALLDWQRLKPVCEVQVKETVRAVQFLHNEQFFAAAQRKYAYIYDKRGIEVHCLKAHTQPRALQFLPHHFLLASVGTPGVLHYQDTSTGALVAQHRTRLGPCGVMALNHHNAVLQLGHANGVVTMWTPNLSSPAVRMLCHKGPVSALATDRNGRHMVTAGVDGQVAVWDLRKLQPMHSYFTRSPASTVDISQQGLLAVGCGRKVQVWKDAVASKAVSPYLVHHLETGHVEQLAFCPYEDVLGCGATGGVSSMLVPGAGEPNFDSRVADPYQAKKARREMEVAHLLDKLQPSMISMDSTVGLVRREPKEVQQERQQQMIVAAAERRSEQRAVADQKTKMKGKNRPSRRQGRKQSNIIEDKKPEVLQRMKEQQSQKSVSKLAGAGKNGKRKFAPNAAKQHGDAPKAKQDAADLSDVPRALHSFFKK